MKKLPFLVFLLLFACQANPTQTIIPASTPTNTIAVEQNTPGASPVTVPVQTLMPTIPVSLVELEGAQVLPGFSLTKFADLPRPTAIAFDAAGKMYVSSQDGNVYVLADPNLDGRADSRYIFASGYDVPLGIAVQASTGDVYLSHQGVISVLSDRDGDGRADEERILAGDLPFGLHQNDNLEFGPDGRLYVGVGSTCDACDDTNPLSASILQFNVETGERFIFATGMRNPFDIAFDPATGHLFATDNGRDDLGMDAPDEELNYIVQGGDYGYPDCWNGAAQPDCENRIPAIAFFEPHSSADGLVINSGQNFPTEYHGNAFVTIFGSWLKTGVQTGIQRIVLSSNGNTYHAETSWFVLFPQGVMPLPLAFGPDDRLYVGAYIGDAIYRISYGTP